MAESVNILVVTGAPDPIKVSVESLRDAILNHPDAFVSALRSALAAPTAEGIVAPPPGGGAFPSDTPIFKMVDPQTARKLTANAAKLTKGDLVALQTGQKTLAELNLTTADVDSIQEAFSFVFPGGQTPKTPDGLKVTVRCCCCTPCCTAVAVTRGVRVA